MLLRARLPHTFLQESYRVVRSPFSELVIDSFYGLVKNPEDGRKGNYRAIQEPRRRYELRLERLLKTTRRS